MVWCVCGVCGVWHVWRVWCVCGVWGVWLGAPSLSPSCRRQRAARGRQGMAARRASPGWARTCGRAARAQWRGE
eukprot:3231165-Prymnesium_polylepis.1